MLNIVKQIKEKKYYTNAKQQKFKKITIIQLNFIIFKVFFA